MIPKTIHHVWPGSDPFRSELHRFRKSFLDCHPDWSLRFWRTDLGAGVSDDVRALLDDPRYTVVVRSDVARFELLRLHGGVYADTDMECLRPMDDLLDNEFFCGRESDSAVCPSLVGCVPGHPLASDMVRHALARIRAAGPEAANARPNEVSGPVLLTELLQGRTDVTIYPREHFYPIGWWETDRLGTPTPDSYARHWWNGKTSADGWTNKQVFAPSSPATRGMTPPGNTRPDGPVRYDLGGVWTRAGWVTVNLVPGADRQCDITRLDRLHPGDGEVDEFLLEHTLEHVPVTEYVQFLRDLHRKLRPAGRLTVVQTDADAVLRQYVGGNLTFRSMRSTLFTPEDRLRDNPKQAHQNMWSADELARDLRAIGFDAVTFDAGNWGMDMWDPLYPDDIRRDWGKRIKNLGVSAVKRA